MFSILLAAAVACAKTQQVGDVSVTCGSPGAWTFAASVSREGGAEIVTIDLASPEEIRPPKFDVDFKFSGADVHHVWT